MIYSAIEPTPIELGATRADGDSWVQYLVKRETVSPALEQHVVASRNLENLGKQEVKAPPKPERIDIAMGRADNRFNRVQGKEIDGVVVTSSAHAVKAVHKAERSDKSRNAKPRFSFVEMVMGQGHAPRHKRSGGFVAALGAEKKDLTTFRERVENSKSEQTQLAH